MSTTIGPGDKTCPMHKKSMSEVCHMCPLWMHIRGRNPNTGEDLDGWNCTLAHLPVLILETANMARETGAAVESFRNEMADQNNRLIGQLTHQIGDRNGAR